MMDAVRRRGGTLLGGRPVRAVVRLATVAVTLLAAVAGCAAPQEGRALATGSVTAGLDPTGIVRGSDGSDDDRVAAATLRNLEIYWEREYPRLAGRRPFPPLAGSYSVDSTLRGRGTAVPCSGDPAELEGNAYYCPRADVLAFDRSALVPVLREDFGDAAVVVVLAHEFGHAVQQRLGATGAVGPGSPGGSLFGGPQFFAPTILLEGQADCYAAAFLRQVRDGALPDLRTGTSGVDDAMSALVTFRDPVGTGASDADAHGNAYDRVSSFQMGFEGGPGTCAGMTVTNRLFTQRSFTSLSDAQSGGNLPLEQLVTALGSDLDRFYAQVVRARGRPWTAPRSVAGVGCDGADPQGAVSYCLGRADGRRRRSRGAGRPPVRRRLRDGYAARLPLRARDPRCPRTPDQRAGRGPRGPLPGRCLHRVGRCPGDRLLPLPRRPRRGREPVAARRGRLPGLRRRHQPVDRVRPDHRLPRRHRRRSRRLPRGRLSASGHSRSMIVALAMPPASHMV